MGCYHSPVKSNTHYISCGPGFESLALHSFTLIKLIYPMDTTICLLNLSLNCGNELNLRIRLRFAKTLKMAKTGAKKIFITLFVKFSLSLKNLFLGYFNHSNYLEIDKN